MTPDELRAALARAFPGAQVDVTDLTGTQDHYKARIVAEAFAGKGKLQQHRLVYAALGDAMRGPVHALALETYSPEDWAKRGA
ncbi:MAG: BolA family transcriptional regulator [Deltaproteobacteria bacterium]|nr:BolA family transcriptional regulator [Deltaproteobacteria bacterium]